MSILEQLHSDENMKIMHIHLRFFIRLDLPLAVTTVMGIWISWESPTSPELKSFLLEHVHRSSRVDHEMSLFWLCRRGCRHYPSFGRRVERIFWLLFWVCEHPLPVPRRLCGRTAPVLGFRLAFFPRIWEPMDFAPEVRTFEWFPATDPSFPEFSLDASWPSRTWLCDSIPTFHFPEESTFSEGYHGTHKPNWIVSVNKATDFFDFLLGCPPASVCRKLTSVTILASGFRLVIQAHGRVPEVTRRFCARSSEDFLHGLSAFQSWRTFSSQIAIFARLSSVSLCRRSWSRRGWLCPLTRMRPVVKTTGVSSWTLSVRFPLKAFSHFSFRADDSPFLTLDPYSCFMFFHSGLWNFVSLSSDEYVVLP